MTGDKRPFIGSEEASPPPYGSIEVVQPTLQQQANLPRSGDIRKKLRSTRTRAILAIILATYGAGFFVGTLFAVPALVLAGLALEGVRGNYDLAKANSRSKNALGFSIAAALAATLFLVFVITNKLVYGNYFDFAY